MLGKQTLKVYDSISIWNSFQKYISSGQPVQDCPVLKKGANLLNYETERITSTKVDIRRTIQSLVFDGNKKVVLSGGYVDIKDGKIIYLKFL